MTGKLYYVSRKNKTALRKKLGIFGKKNLVLHHVDITMKDNDIERYIQWNEADVVILTASEHNGLHSKGRPMPEEAKKKISEARKGKPRLEETKNKISETLKIKNSNPTL